LYAEDSGFAWLISHNPRWTAETGTTAARGRTISGGGTIPGVWVSTSHAASPAAVGASNTASMLTGRSRIDASRAATLAADNEFPPMSKNPSSTLTRSRSSTAATTAAMVASNSVRGATYSPPPRNSIAGRAARSILPIGVRGNSSTTSITCGTRWLGRCSRANASNDSGAMTRPAGGET